MGIRHRAARATPTATPLGDSSGGLNLSLSVCLSRVLGWSLVAGRRWCCSSAALLLLALAGRAAGLGGGLLRAAAGWAAESAGPGQPRVLLSLFSLFICPASLAASLSSPLHAFPSPP